MNDQQVRLLFETLGTDGVKALREALTEVDTEGKKVEQDLDKTADQFNKVDAAAKKASGGVAGFGQAALQSGRVVQDFAQGGIPGILNNIEGLTMALGLGSGLAGALTIAGVAAFVFKDKIIETFNAISGAPKSFTTAIEDLEKKLKELQDKPYKLVIDVVQIEEAQQKLDALKKSLAEYEAQQRMQKVAEVESGKKIQEAIRESALGAGGVETKVTDFLKEVRMGAAEAPGGRIAAAREKLAQAESDQAFAAQKMRDAKSIEEYTYALGISTGHQKRIAAAKEEEARATTEIENAVKIEYAEVLRRAREGTGAAQAEAQKRLQVLLTGAGERGLAGEIAGVSPEMVQRTKDLASIGAGAEPAARAELARAQKERDQERAFDQAAADTVTKLNKEKREKAEKAEGEAFDLQAQADYKKIEEEKKRIERTVGAPWQRQFEVTMAANTANLAAGMGGMDPSRLSQQLQSQMVAEMKRRGAVGGAALGAARDIVAKGEADLGRRAADASQTNLSIAGQTLAISRQLVSEYARMNSVQQQLVSEAKSQQQALKASSRTRLAR